MTLKILKPKVNVTLTLDNEFIQYCKLNNIENIEEFAKEVFNQGFTIIKYGAIPQIDIKTETKVVKAGIRKVETDIIVEQGEPEIVVPKKILKDLYDE